MLERERVQAREADSSPAMCRSCWESKAHEMAELKRMGDIILSLIALLEGEQSIPSEGILHSGHSLDATAGSTGDSTVARWAPGGIAQHSDATGQQCGSVTEADSAVEVPNSSWPWQRELNSTSVPLVTS